MRYNYQNLKILSRGGGKHFKNKVEKKLKSPSENSSVYGTYTILKVKVPYRKFFGVRDLEKILQNRKKVKVSYRNFFGVRDLEKICYAL